MCNELNRCEVCFNWVWTVQLTRQYTDSPWYIKHSYTTWNLCMKQQNKGKNGLRTLCTALNRGISKFVGDTICRLLFRLQPRTERSNVSNTFELDATLSTPDLETHAYMCKKVFCLIRAEKTYSSLLLAFFDLGWQNLSSLKAERPGSEFVNNATLPTAPAMAAKLDLNWEANETHLWQSRVESKVIPSHISIALLSLKRRITELPLRVGLIRAS